MSKNSHITAAAIFTTLALTGCTIGETPTSTNTPSPQPTPSLKSVAKQAVQQPLLAQPFNDPVVSTRVSMNSGAVASLIQPTNSTERLIVVKKGRTDPFGQIVEPIGSTTALGPQIVVPTLPPLPTTSQQKLIKKKPAQTAQLPKKSAQTAQLPKKSVKTAQLPKKSGFNPVLPRVLAGSVNSPKFTTVLPPIRQPEMARAVIVTGVVLIGKTPQAIVKVPDELSSRYVRPGQRLVNGVLVKRIEISQGANPTVILEEYGIEVAKQVGEQPVKASTPTSSPAATPSPAAGNAVSVIKYNLVGAAS
ncbi:MAG: hypothetical protein ACK513_11710 [Aphanizomenon sp.]|jgi:hypothetical protein|uniref:Uncharacterized protein n=1 Tax=Aphanizomenon flos-aquae LD13 TaxID=1710894 RepID=A0A1B7W0I6_APHFL|nr:hypothetical protein [Aphanizomenon flos-aquae UKL13-PB]MBO1061922.1 hypothetical protein [Aphanizomenon flos-aquae CP01]OBQ26782.1 MAG: hypothetical protein AN481_03510 [Aphanizomenon flos-aquae LD13]OBQ29107.1 MAG: hypothetical protein AN483_12265 [Aphanizomenon flos-aquae MDT14a]HCQ22071.1 hypothetical protein [Anabaena sp. UBA12330]